MVIAHSGLLGVLSINSKTALSSLDWDFTNHVLYIGNEYFTAEKLPLLVTFTHFLKRDY